MKTKVQKQEELKKGAELFNKSQVVLFADFSKLPAETLRELRRSLATVNAKFFVTKKRLLAILLKQKGIEFNVSERKTSFGTVCAEGSIESVSAPFYKFFKALKLETQNIVGGYDLATKRFLEPAEIIMFGSLPPREVLLAQLAGMMAAPIRSFMYIADQKSKQ